MGVPPRPSVSNDVVVDAYDRLATGYDLVVAPLEAGTRRRAIEALAVDPGDRVLELGCGPGHALVPFARLVDGGEYGDGDDTDSASNRVSGRTTERNRDHESNHATGHATERDTEDGSDQTSGHVIGLDAAPGMLSRADRRVSDAEKGERIDLARGDARRLPIATDCVDVVFVEDTLELFGPDAIRRVLAECDRVLTEDGTLGVVTMEREGAERDRFVRWYEWVYRHVPGYDRMGCRPIYARRALEAAGFEIERRERHHRWNIWPVDVLIARPGRS